jgi:hypothetical protein
MTGKALLQGALFAAAGSLITLGCMHATQAAGPPQNPTTIDGLTGYTLRVIKPGEMTSMLYMQGRVNVYVDADNKITRVSFF